MRLPNAVAPADPADGVAKRILCAHHQRLRRGRAGSDALRVAADDLDPRQRARIDDDRNFGLAHTARDTHDRAPDRTQRSHLALLGHPQHRLILGDKLEADSSDRHASRIIGLRGEKRCSASRQYQPSRFDDDLKGFDRRVGWCVSGAGAPLHQTGRDSDGDASGEFHLQYRHSVPESLQILQRLLRVSLLCAFVGQVGVAAAQSSPNSGLEDSANPETSIGSAGRQQVRFRNEVLFDVTVPIGDLAAPDRAAAIERRLLAAAGGSADVLEKLRVLERDGRSEIYAGEALIRTVVDADARGTGRTRRQLAADQTVLIRQALAIEFRDRSVASLLRSALYAGLASLLLAVLLFVVVKMYRNTRAGIINAARKWQWKSGIAGLRLVSPSTVASASRTIAATLGWLTGLAVVYVYLEYVLSLFPWTRGIAATMVTASRGAIVKVATGLLGYVPNLLNIAVIMVVARLILKAVRTLFEQLRSERMTLQGFYPEWAMPTYSLLRFLVIAIAAVMVFPYLPGSGSEGFKGISVFVGLLVSLGAASAIANVIAGIVITYMRPFAVGDRVKIADTVGDVTSKDLFVVRVRTIKNVDITVPNSLVLANHIVNYSSHAKSHGLILPTTVTIGYDAPWARVHETLIGAARKVEGILAEPAPFVLQTALNDFYVSYELNATTDKPNDMAAIYSRLHSEIQDAFNAAGIEILSPHYAAVRDGGKTSIPDQYLPKDYRAPRFNVFANLLKPTQGT